MGKSWTWKKEYLQGTVKKYEDKKKHLNSEKCWYCWERLELLEKYLPLFSEHEDKTSFSQVLVNSTMQPISRRQPCANDGWLRAVTMGSVAWRQAVAQLRRAEKTVHDDCTVLIVQIPCAPSQYCLRQRGDSS
jgi:hypothetical protein